MKKNLYYRTVFKRSNAFKEGVLAFFEGILFLASPAAGSLYP